jgi:hypothetical protein
MVRLNDEAAGDPVLAFDEYFQQGHSLVTSPEAQKAFDISQESPETRERYGRDGFGQRCLLARRLVDAGVPFITVYDGGWDHHSDIFGALAKASAIVGQLCRNIDSGSQRARHAGFDPGDCVG